MRVRKNVPSGEWLNIRTIRPPQEAREILAETTLEATLFSQTGGVVCQSCLGEVAKTTKELAKGMYMHEDHAGSWHPSSTYLGKGAFGALREFEDTIAKKHANH